MTENEMQVLHKEIGLNLLRAPEALKTTNLGIFKMGSRLYHRTLEDNIHLLSWKTFGGVDMNLGRLQTSRLNSLLLLMNFINKNEGKEVPLDLVCFWKTPVVGSEDYGYRAIPARQDTQAMKAWAVKEVCYAMGALAPISWILLREGLKQQQLEKKWEEEGTPSGRADAPDLLARAERATKLLKDGLAIIKEHLK